MPTPQGMIDRYRREVNPPRRAMEFREMMVALVRLFWPHTYVEVGVAGGYTFNEIAPMVDRAVAVDLRPMPGVIERTNVETFQMPSRLFALWWTFFDCGPIDLLFIDANHSARSVIDDLEGLAPFVREGTGLVCLHDTHPNQVDRYARKTGYAWNAAWQVRTETRWRGAWEIVTLPGPVSGMSLLRKSRNQLSWRSCND